MDYYPFGQLLRGRSYSGPSYRYGFNGMEKDDEVKGEGNSYDFGARMLDPRVGRFFAVDPLEKKYPWYTPYQFSGNKVIQFVELEGAEEGLPNYLDDSDINFVEIMYATAKDIEHSFNNLVTNGLLRIGPLGGYQDPYRSPTYWKIYAEQLRDYGYAPSDPSSYVQWSYDIDPQTGYYDLKNSRAYIVPRGSNKEELMTFLSDIVTVGLAATSFKVGGMSGPMILAQRTGVGEATLISTFKRFGKEISLKWGNAKKGMEHILKRHSADEYLNNPGGKGDLFPVVTTDNQIMDGINEVFSKGTRVSDPLKAVQTYEKRIKINGESANYRLIVDETKSEVVTFFKINQ
ncbi:MAG: hypothetical protein HC854_12570 [Flavobacterium sp.]|nr:hypothetical protein [Flavobacterium sp.]